MKYVDLSDVLRVCINCKNAVDYDCEGDLRCKKRAGLIGTDEAGNQTIIGGQVEFLGSCDKWEKDE